MTHPTKPSYPKPFIPAGLCQCGCGAATRFAPANDPRYGIKKGDSLKFLRGHSRMRQWVPGKAIPFLYPPGTCQCGCGGTPKIARSTDKAWGYVKGQPRPYIHSHQYRLSPVNYIAADSGYSTPCWIWQLATTQGYGRMMQKGHRSPRPAHLVYYERANGPVPNGLELDHLCRVRPCVNPDHLEPVTHAENVRRGLVTKLSAPEVAVMRVLRGKGWTYAALGRLFYVVGETCRTACIGNTWEDID